MKFNHRAQILKLKSVPRSPLFLASVHVQVTLYETSSDFEYNKFWVFKVFISRFSVIL